MENFADKLRKTTEKNKKNTRLLMLEGDKILFQYALERRTYFTEEDHVRAERICKAFQQACEKEAGYGRNTIWWNDQISHIANIPTHWDFLTDFSARVEAEQTKKRIEQMLAEIGLQNFHVYIEKGSIMANKYYFFTIKAKW